MQLGQSKDQVSLKASAGKVPGATIKRPLMGAR